MDIDRTMREAAFALRSGLPGRAEDILMRLVEEAPGHAPAWVALGNVAVQRRRPDAALERFGKALALVPSDGPAQLWTGILLLHKGRAAEALPHLQGAFAVNPNDGQVLAPLAQAYFQLGQLESAIDAYDAALRLMPHDPDLLTSRATCLVEALRFGEAEADLEHALAARPTAAAYSLRARMDQQLGRPTEALSQAEAAISREPDNAVALSIAASAMVSLGRTEEADRYWDQAERLSPARAAFLNAKAKTYLDHGDFLRAHALLVESMAAEPTFGETYYSYVSSKRISDADDEVVEAIERLAQAPGLRDHDRLFFLYALGKAYADRREFRAAIESFDRANALKQKIRGGKPFDRERFKAYFDGQIERYTPELIERGAALGSRSTVPIFVLGMMRSGTSLMEQILSSHPAIGGAGEQAFWHEREGIIHPPGAGELDEARIGPLAEQFEARLQSAAPGYARVVDKNPANAMLAGLLTIAYPHAKIVNIRRHPVDTALSIWMTPMRTTAPFVATRGDIVFAFRQYLRLAEHWNRVIPADRFQVVQYERLTSDPEPVIRQVIDFCDVPWHPACLHPERNPRPVSTPSFWQVRQPLNRGSVDRWRDYAPWLQEFEELFEEAVNGAVGSRPEANRAMG